MFRRMNRPKVAPEAYIDFLIAVPRQATATEAARCQPPGPDPPAHDAFTRLLHRLEPDPEPLWREAEPEVDRSAGVLVLDDSVLDKPYARKMGLVSYAWSGKHQRVVKGIDLLTLLWTDGDRHVPCDYRVYDRPADGKTKNDHFRDLLRAARERGFSPACVVFDSWFSGLDNLKLLRSFGWRWLTRLKSNRKVNPDRTGLRPVREVDIPAAGLVVHLEGYGLVKVFRIEAKDGDTEYWATGDLGLGELDRLRLAEHGWRIEEFHRGLKQVTNVERCQARAAVAQRNHVGLALRAFLRVERWSFHTGMGWLSAKWDVVRAAVRAYLAHPRYTLPAQATA
jgi:DDE superfamily endonuclease